jgi:uncharacterized protein YciI
MRLIALLLALTLTAGAAMADTAATLYVLIYRQGPAWQADKPMGRQPSIRAHGAYMKALFDKGISFAAGPTTDAPGGIVIVRASSLDEAKALTAADPGVSSGMFSAEVHAWTPVFRSDKPLPTG